MKMKRPSTSPGILQKRRHDFTFGLPLQISGSTLQLPNAHSSPSRGSTLPTSRPGSPQSAHSRFTFPWEGIEPPSPLFDEHSPPSTEQLELAAKSSVVSESGVRVAFGSLWQDQKTIIIFIRHFLCPMCQDYVLSTVQSMAPEALRRDGLRLVIISNGHHDFIKSYRKITKCPYEIYTDSKNDVYNALGMTFQKVEKGPHIVHQAWRVIANAFKSGMPLWRHGGDIAQLGGEFVLGPGMKCSFSHRMRYVRSHLPIHKVVQAAIAEPEGPRLPEILVIGRDHPNHLGGSTSSRTSVLEVFHKDYQDEDSDFRPPNPTVVKKGRWNLPSTRRSWIIQEDGEDEQSDLALPDRIIDKGKTPSESEHHETKRVSMMVAQADIVRIKTAQFNDPGEGLLPTATTVDWRGLRRGNMKLLGSEDAPHPGIASRRDGAGKSFPKDIPKDISPADIGRDSTSLSLSLDSGIDSSEGRISCDSDSSTTPSQEAQVRKAFVLKLLPTLDLDVSLKFEEFPWLGDGRYQCPPSRRSSLDSFQLDPQFLTSSKDRNGGSLIHQDMHEVWM